MTAPSGSRAPTVPGRVSVIMPVLDGARFLGEAIESVLGQRYPAWELLVVDDGSKDESLEIAREYADRFPGRILALPPEGEGRGGASRARNRGIAAATGEYIGLLDADDVWLPGKLSAQVDRLRSHPRVGLVYGPTLWWYGWTGRPEDTGRDVAVPVGPESEIVIPGPRALELMLRHRLAVPCTCGLLVRTSLVRAVGGFETQFLRLYTDQSFFAKLLLRTPVLVMHEVHDLYRQHPKSSCNSASPEDHKRARRTYLDWLVRYLRDTGPHDVRVLRAARADRSWLHRGTVLRRLRRFWLKRTHRFVWGPGRRFVAPGVYPVGGGASPPAPGRVPVAGAHTSAARDPSGHARPSGETRGA